ncbi:MAG: tail fiber domain-containing protein [Saprospiraceae bacterium]|nr:tail fiber domain-containing protein [Saprospiraceae bacterium]
MKKIFILGFLVAISLQIIAQVTYIGPAIFEAETELPGQVAIEGYSGPIGVVVYPPTDPGSIGVRGIGFTGVMGEGKADVGNGVYGKTSRYNAKGVRGESSGTAGNGVYGLATGKNGWGVYGRANGEGEWGGYFSGGKGLLARPRLGVENFNPQHPIHVGTTGSNGNGAHVTVGGSWVNGSSRSFKTDFQSIDNQEILEKLSNIDISLWQYKESNEGHHIGPVAEDFYEAFSLGKDQKYISTTDADGVALACIQALYDRVLVLEETNGEQAEMIRQLSKCSKFAKYLSKNGK